MGNKTSSHQHPHPAYFPHGSFPDGRSGNYIIPTHHHSMSSLNHLRGTDSGYLTSPGDSGERSKLRHSRMSLNEFAFEHPMHMPPPPMAHPMMFPAGPPPDPKLLKKWHKKQKKLIKKIGVNNLPNHMMHPFPLPPMPPGVRSMSTDNIYMHSAQSNPFTTASLSEYRMRNSTDDSSGIVTSVSSQQPSPTTPAEQPKLHKSQTKRNPAPNPPISAELPKSPLSSSYHESRSVGTHYESRSIGRQQAEPPESFEDESLFDEPPVKVTPEAMAILERNARMYSAICKETVDSDITNRKETVSTKKLRSEDERHSEKDTNEHQQSATKREPAYASSTSSVTTSNIRGGEDIDFSWVNDMQNSLDREFSHSNSHRRSSSPECIPVCYFGMEAPVMECVPKAVTEKITAKPALQHDPKQVELKQIHSNVRSKAAMFDSEAQKNEKNLIEQRQAAQRYRSRSIPRLTGQQDPYIPNPDYGMNSSNRISVDTRPPPPPYQHRYFGDSRRDEPCSSHTMSPSARRIRRADGPQQFANARLTDQMRPEEVQKSRVYNATEYYKQSARRNSESSWRASVAY
ncbi:hypothetical protein QR680_002284 [Steinernema hermaphroditum]|uniref:Uncharacterized protein n=1 Tax=Steinernema hermaphroditum TaxID=289476 RepID=A0AA39LHV8_9BILA|nr:hypothetical protein QR680_002284 [Steinernema hermaphroditum]